MVISEESLRGYILEEVLAYLIRNTGYKLLVDPQQDPNELTKKGGGLAVKGRGADHQVDVLGELKWIPAFTYPLRLIVEAKFREEKTGIDVVRNAVAALIDINQYNMPRKDVNRIRHRHQYVYAIFSTSGFTKPAVDMAIAHQVSLIDLSGDEYSELKEAIKDDAHMLSTFSRDMRSYGVKRDKLLTALRYVLRKKLRTLPYERLCEDICRDELFNFLSNMFVQTIKVSSVYQELFVGMASGPFMLLLKANEPVKFLQYCKENPVHNIMISWSGQRDTGRIWTIRPLNREREYELYFKLPERLYKWIFESGRSSVNRNRARGVKEKYFSSITIYRYDETEQRDYLFRLQYDPNRFEVISSVE